jgi:hypothetical protein
MMEKLLVILKLVVFIMVGLLQFQTLLFTVLTLDLLEVVLVEV